MDSEPFIMIVVAVIFMGTIRHFRGNRPRVNRTTHAARSPESEAVLREIANERRHFISLGLRPLQVALAICFWIYVIAVVSQIWHYWSQVHLLRALFSPIVDILFWLFQLSCCRVGFLMLAAAMAGGLISSRFHLATDNFCVAISLARVAVSVISLTLYCKMKSTTSSSHDA